MDPSLIDRLRSCVRDIANFPKTGILFRDCMPVLKDPQLIADLCKQLATSMKQNHSDTKITAVAALEARGFLFAPLIAQHLKCACLPIRKKGKLPGETWHQEYELEYGKDMIEIQRDAVGPEDNVVIFDDLLATGGTLCASIDLVRKAGVKILGTYVLMELSELKGRDRITAKNVDCYSMLTF